MKLSIALTSALVALVAGAGVPTQNLPHFAVSIELEDVEKENSGTAPVARKQIQVYESDVHDERPVAASPRNKADFAETMATIIYQRSSKQKCGLTRGSINDISFRYIASGDNCYTTALREIIQEALKTGLNLPGNDAIWPSMCLRLTHGGAWKGYLAVGRSDLFDDSLVCDSTLTFNNECTGGGKKDARSISDVAAEESEGNVAAETMDSSLFPDTWFSYGVETFDNQTETSDIQARAQDQACTAKSTVFGNVTNFIISANTVKTIIESIVSLFKTKSNNKDCAVSTGSFSGIAYRYYASGEHCSTMSEVGTIEGALYHQFQTMQADKIPESECIRFDHDGKWRGWLLYGPLGKVNLAEYCGPSRP